MLSYLADFEAYFGPLRLFRYITLRAAFAGLTAMSIGFIMGPWLFAKLRALSASQSLRTKDEVGELAELHASKVANPDNGWADDLCCCGCQCGAVGAAECVCVYGAAGLSRPDGARFLDDYLKVVKKNSDWAFGSLEAGGAGAAHCAWRC